MKLRLLTVLVAFITFSAAIRAQSGGGAVYEVDLPDECSRSLVETVRVDVSPAGAPAGCFWHRIKCTKLDDSGFTLWILADGASLDPNASGNTNFRRYIFQETGRNAVEYINARTQKALLPLFDFTGELLPRPDTGSWPSFEKGTFLGHRLRRKASYESGFVDMPRVIVKLVLNPDLLIGTSRNFRDDGSGRPSAEANYNYVPLTRVDYARMIAAGFNYFLVDERQIEHIRNESVFYENYSRKIDYPEELFRSNFMGAGMFIDEPACRLAGKYDPQDSPTDAVRRIQKYIADKQSRFAYRTRLQQGGIDIGSMKLTEPAIPIWETYVGTTYYQLEANRYGLVQECRWQIRPGNEARGRILQRVNEEFGTDIPVTPRNVFVWYYSQMIGPARALKARWGMSLYGQSEPELRVPSMKLAYDMGASFIWFWTSDHDHHVPFVEQLGLAKAITDYAEANPRPPLQKLLERADVAIVLPYGYMLPSCWGLHMFGTHFFPLSRENSRGLTYKQVLAPALKHVENCLKNDIAYDVLPAGEAFDPNDYRCVIRINEDGKVTITED